MASPLNLVKHRLHVWRQDGPDRGVFPQHAAEAAARHDQQDQVEQEGQGGRDLGALVGDARKGNGFLRCMMACDWLVAGALSPMDQSQAIRQ